MNSIPITLTIYYPTVAQVEAYMAFTAMLSIALCGIMLIASLGFSKRTFEKFKEPHRLSFAIYMISGNPLGALAARCNLIVLTAC